MFYLLKKLDQPANKTIFAGRSFFVQVNLLLLLCLPFGLLKAQTSFYIVYETANTSAGNKIFKSLITLQPDGNAIARIQYNAGPANTLFLYEQALSDSRIEQNGVTSKYLSPNADALPLLAPDTSGFAIPRFIFKKLYDSSGYYYEPAGVELQNEKGVWITVNMTLSQQKDYKELRNDEPFVSSFYFESDGFYQYIFEQATRAAPLARNEKMFLIVVANTKDETVGKTVEIDLKNVSALFNSLATNLGISKVIPLYISGDGYSKTAVEAALLALEAQKPAPIDIVVFYFSGHGFRVPGDTSKYPRMSFRTAKNKANKEIGDNIPLENVYKRINALKPRVNLVLGDCCNADIYENPVLGTDMIKPKGGGALGYFNLEAAKKLFLPITPLSIIVGSVEKDHLSVGNPDTGSFYTQFFKAALQKNIWGYYSNDLLSFGGQTNASWLRILLEARKNTYWKAKAEQCGKTTNDRCIQQAEMSVDNR